MKLKMFAVYDLKAQFFGQPFFEQEEASAIRAFGDEVNNSSKPGNMWFAHPEDYQLYVVGHFENSNGVLSGTTPDEVFPRALVMASSLIRGPVEIK